MRSIKQLGSLKGRRALVAGGAGHVGRAAVETLKELGAKVLVLDRAASNGGLRCDLHDDAAARAAAREAVRRLGGLDILIHAAGYVGTSQASGWGEPLARQSSAAFEAALKVNVLSAFALTQTCAPALSRSGKGSVVFFSSIYGLVGPDMSLYAGTTMANPTGYGASKGALVQLARYFATQLAPKVRVNVVSPGGIKRGQPFNFAARYNARTPLKRMAVEEDLKGAIAYLASDLSAYVTGHDLVVDGGFTAW